jgi:hypothetical protein
MKVTSPLIYAIQDHETAQHKHESYCKLDGDLIQEIIPPLHGLNLSNRPGAPNASRRHRPPDFPPQSIPGRSERVTLSLSFSSLIFVLKVSGEEICTTHADHAHRSPKFEFIAGSYLPR